MGPVFISEPPPQVDFLNTTGAAVDCLAYGNPSPRVRWRVRDGSTADNVPGLRQTLPNGTLVLWPFRPEHYRQDVHADVYRCEAANAVGTVVSRDVHVRGGMCISFFIFSLETIVKKLYLDSRSFLISQNKHLPS